MSWHASLVLWYQHQVLLYYSSWVEPPCCLIRSTIIDNENAGIQVLATELLSKTSDSSILAVVGAHMCKQVCVLCWARAKIPFMWKKTPAISLTMKQVTVVQLFLSASLRLHLICSHVKHNKNVTKNLQAAASHAGGNNFSPLRPLRSFAATVSAVNTSFAWELTT